MNIEDIKVGDEVVCIGNVYGLNITVGNVYTILDIESYYFTDELDYKIVNDIGAIYYYATYLFKGCVSIYI